MGRPTTAAVAVVLAWVVACSPANSGEYADQRSTTTTTANPATPTPPAGVRVDPGTDSTTITGPAGERTQLPGRFEFDALSTDGRLLYLIEHRPPKGSENYRVRVYDFSADELRKRPVADKRNLQTDMTGRPMAQTTSADGVWVFTLYRGAEHAFVHALNVDRAEALCLDLPHGSGQGSGSWSLTIAADGSKLHAVAGSARDSADFDLRDVLF